MLRCSVRYILLIWLAGCATSLGTGGSGVSPTAPQDFGELDHLLDEGITGIELGAQRLKTRLMRGYREELTDRVVPALRHLATEARDEVSRAQREREDIARLRCERRAGRHYGAAFLAMQALTLELNLALVGDSGYALGQPGFDVANKLQAYHASIEPLLDAAFRGDMERFAAVLPAARQSYQQGFDVLYHWMDSVKKGAEISQATLLVADLMLIVLTLPAGGGPIVPTAGASRAASGEAVLRTLDAAIARESAEAIRRLIASGALDGAIVAGLLHAGSRGLANDNTSQKAPDARLAELSKDPATSKSGKAKGEYEAKIGLELEERGVLPGPIKRDPSGNAEFIDARGTLWDIKSFRSFVEGRGKFELKGAMERIRIEINAGENLVIDTSYMSTEHIEQLRRALQDQGLIRHIIWYP